MKFFVENSSWAQKKFDLHKIACKLAKKRYFLWRPKFMQAIIFSMIFPSRMHLQQRGIHLINAKLRRGSWHEQVMSKCWASDEKITNKSWTSNDKVMNKIWTSQDYLDRNKSLTSCEQIMYKSCYEQMMNKWKLLCHGQAKIKP